MSLLQQLVSSHVDGGASSTAASASSSPVIPDSTATSVTTAASHLLRASSIETESDNISAASSATTNTAPVPTHQHHHHHPPMIQIAPLQSSPPSTWIIPSPSQSPLALTPLDADTLMSASTTIGGVRNQKRGYSLFANSEGEYSNAKRPAHKRTFVFNAQTTNNSTHPSSTSSTAPSSNSSSTYSSVDTSITTLSHLSSFTTPSASNSPVLTSSLPPQSLNGVGFSHILCPDPRAFEEAHVFTQKTQMMNVAKTHQPTSMLAAAPSSSNNNSSLLNNLNNNSTNPLPLPLANKKSSRQHYKCPPTPAPRMCLSGTSDLYINKKLLQEDYLKDDSDDEDEDEDEGIDPDDPSIIDIHALSSFTNNPTYASSDPFSHTSLIQSTSRTSKHTSQTGPYLFQKQFKNHKLVGCGSFFEVFRVERREKGEEEEDEGMREEKDGGGGGRRNSNGAEMMMMDEDDTMEITLHPYNSPKPTTNKQPSQNNKVKKKLRVYAIKKSLKTFHSEYDRDCYLRESKILAYVNRVMICHPSTTSSAVPSSTLLPPSHRNPHIVRSYLVWQEGGHLFERLEYCLCTLNELIFIMNETNGSTAAPVTAINNDGGVSRNNTPCQVTPPSSQQPSQQQSVTSPLTRPSGLSILTDTHLDSALQLTSVSSSSSPSSYFQQNMLRTFLSILTQITLALYTLHKNGLVHLDVKPDNILVHHKNSRLVLSDFGFARRLERKQRRHDGGEDQPDSDSDDDDSSPFPSPIPPLNREDSTTDACLEGDSVYMAPELLALPTSSASSEASGRDGEESKEDGGEMEDTPLSSPQHITTACDIFSLGLLLFELLSNCELPKSGYLWRRLRTGFVKEYLPKSTAVSTTTSTSGSPTDSTSATQSSPHTGEDIPGLSWMSSIIINLLEPIPEKRMTCEEILVKVEEKLRETGWLTKEEGERIDASISSVSSSTIPLETTSRAAHLVYAWTTSLPSLLTLPSLHSLNYHSLLLRSQEALMSPSPHSHSASQTPIPTPRASPIPLWPGAVVRTAASPGVLRRQLSSPMMMMQQGQQQTLNGMILNSRQLSSPMTMNHTLHPAVNSTVTSARQLMTNSNVLHALNEMENSPPSNVAAPIPILPSDSSHPTPTASSPPSARPGRRHSRSVSLGVLSTSTTVFLENMAKSQMQQEEKKEDSSAAAVTTDDRGVKIELLPILSSSLFPSHHVQALSPNFTTPFLQKRRLDPTGAAASTTTTTVTQTTAQAPVTMTQTINPHVPLTASSTTTKPNSSSSSSDASTLPTKIVKPVSLASRRDESRPTPHPAVNPIRLQAAAILLRSDSSCPLSPLKLNSPARKWSPGQQQFAFPMVANHHSPNPHLTHVNTSSSRSTSQGSIDMMTLNEAATPPSNSAVIHPYPMEGGAIMTASTSNLETNSTVSLGTPPSFPRGVMSGLNAAATSSAHMPSSSTTAVQSHTRTLFHSSIAPSTTSRSNSNGSSSFQATSIFSTISTAKKLPPISPSHIRLQIAAVNAGVSTPATAAGRAGHATSPLTLTPAAVTSPSSHAVITPESKPQQSRR